MKHRTLKFTTIFLIIILMVLILSACGPTEDAGSVSSSPTESVCILLGNTRNVGLPNYDEIKAEIAQMADAVTDCSVIVIDGDSNFVSYNDTIRYPKTLSFLQESNNNGYIDKVISNILNCRPSSDEVDIISALFNAKKTLSKEDDVNKKIIVFSSGLSTTGALDFANNPKLIEENPKVIVKMLKTLKSLPDLTGVEVVWHGFGIVEEPQESLTKTNEYRLKNIWNAILEACNATIVNGSIEAEISDNSGVNVEELRKDYPNVKTVDFPIIEIDETKVAFKSGTAEFLNKDKVYKELEPYAELILVSKCNNFYLVGSTASADTYSKCLVLSEKRAEAVKNVLCDLGVPSAYLSVYGIGRENFGGNYEWRDNDLNPDGSLNEELAQQNRKVMIIEENSKKGEDFIEIWNKTMK